MSSNGSPRLHTRSTRNFGCLTKSSRARVRACAVSLATLFSIACGASLQPRGATNEDHPRRTSGTVDGGRLDAGKSEAAGVDASDCMPPPLPRSAEVKGPRETIRCKGGGALRLATDRETATGYYVPRDVDDAVDELLAAAAPAGPEAASALVTNCYRELADAWGLAAAGRFAKYGYSVHLGGLTLLYLVHRCTADRANGDQPCDLCKHLRSRSFYSWPGGAPSLASRAESSLQRGGP